MKTIFQIDQIWSVAMDLLGKIIISGLDYGLISILCLKNAKTIRTCYYHKWDVNSVIMNKKCTKLISASDDNKIGICFIVTG